MRAPYSSLATAGPTGFAVCLHWTIVVLPERRRIMSTPLVAGRRRQFDVVALKLEEPCKFVFERPTRQRSPEVLARSQVPLLERPKRRLELAVSPDVPAKETADCRPRGSHRQADDKGQRCAREQRDKSDDDATRAKACDESDSRSHKDAPTQQPREGLVLKPVEPNYVRIAQAELIWLRPSHLDSMNGSVRLSVQRSALTSGRSSIAARPSGAAPCWAAPGYCADESSYADWRRRKASYSSR